MSGTVRYDFTGAVALITGGGRGQGLSHAVSFAEAGARVVVFDVGRTTLPGVPYELGGHGALDSARAQLPKDALVLDVDITDEATVRDAFERVRRDVTRLDVLVNNAGVNAVASVDTTTREQWESILSVNLVGAYLCTKYSMPLLQQSGRGRIINISSMAAALGAFHQVPYAASKAGLLGLTRSLALEAGPFGITVNAICPSLVISPQTTGLMKASRTQPRPLAPPGMNYVLPGMQALEPKDISAAVLWLASSAARYITGTTLVIDGGRSIK